MVFKNIVKRSTVFFKRRKKIIYSVLGLLVLFFFFLHVTYYPLLSFVYKSSDLFESRFGVDIRFDLVNNIDRFYRVFDVGNVFKVKKNLFDGNLPIYDLEFSDNDLNHFNEIADIFVERNFRDDSINEWRKAGLQIDGKNYDVKVKLHGDGKDHWRFEKKSYKVQSSEKYINNMKKFNLILFEDRLLSPKITRILTSYFGLDDIRDDVVVLRINGVPQGLYYVQEFLDENFLENNQCSGCAIVKRTNDYWTEHCAEGSHGLVPISGPAHLSFFDSDISSVADLKTELDSQILFYNINRLFKTIQEEDHEKLLEFFDLDQLSSFEASRRILGDIHDVKGDNLKLIYSASTGKFYPLTAGEEIRKLKLRKGGFENFMNFADDLDGKVYIPLFYFLNKNDQLRHETNKKIYDFIVNYKDDFLNKQEKIHEKYLSYALSYKMERKSPTLVKFLLDYNKDILECNLDLLQKNLEYANIYFNVIKKDNNVRIEIIPDAVSRLKFQKMELVLDEEYSGRAVLKLKEGDELISTAAINVDDSIVNLMDVLQGIPFSAGVDDDLYPLKRVYVLEVSFAENIKVENLDASVVNEVTGDFLPEDDIYFNIADGDGYSSGINEITLEEFKEKYPRFRWQFGADGLVLEKGAYPVTDDLVIPAFSKFTIESGTKLLIAEGKSIISYSPISVNGLVVTALDKNKPFGTFGVVSDGKCEIDHLDISYGSEKFIEGIYFSGALSIHGCDTVISNSKIHDNKADDGLNIKYGDSMLAGNEFFNNFADQVDLDFTTGVVRGNKFFVDEEEDSNGDGLDLSGSLVIVNDNLFRGFADKGVSIGEKTDVVLFENDFNNNNWGSAVKDSSKAYFISNDFAGNNIAVNAYQKKQLFNGGFVYEYGNSYVGKEFESDKKSKRYELVLLDEGLELVETLVDGAEIELLFKFLEKRAEVSVEIEG